MSVHCKLHENEMNIQIKRIRDEKHYHWFMHGNQTCVRNVIKLWTQWQGIVFV